jgi:hypothetical protein
MNREPTAAGHMLVNVFIVTPCLAAIVRLRCGPPSAGAVTLPGIRFATPRRQGKIQATTGGTIIERGRFIVTP